ncbi:aminopeptidase [Dyadobacter psychrotolerans]|uniref:Aminopeptidase n=1 Tax=Dyadobacter psychrotolerans TaxID=2541721 RepID=A0A4R5DEN1_9BACT|nr:aminopeptidase [Dyadobacter psychrotolerans]TDE10321.1 aminopeptidase [Dyadobacter psychrotolerans]
MLKKIFLALLLLLVLLGFLYRDLLSYGWMQAKGQIGILWNVQDVEEVLRDPVFPDSLKSRIRLIEEIKQFGVDSLGLTPSKNYTTFYNQHGKPLIWVITASDRYRIKAHLWKFPILGAFPYKGYFDSTRAVREEKVLIDEGFDTDIGEVSAWSTLGYLKDPILSSMLKRKEGSLANLILHELTHGTLFVKNDLELNENLASFVGDLGAIRFLRQKYGTDSKQLKAYEFSKKYNDAYSQHILRGIGRLDSLYKTFGSKLSPEPGKDSLKKHLILKILNDADTLLGNKKTLKANSYWEKHHLPNNAFFISYQTYKSKQNIFKQEYETKFGGDFKRYLNYLKEKYPSL